jgi:hypothetical protein
MKRLDLSESVVKKAGAWLAEKATEITLLLEGEKAADLGKLQALEALCLGITGKKALWAALQMVQDLSPAWAGVDLPRLISCAEEQYDRTEIVRLQIRKAAINAAVASMKQLDHLELGQLDLTDERVAQVKQFAFLKTARPVDSSKAPYSPELRVKIQRRCRRRRSRLSRARRAPEAAPVPPLHDSLPLRLCPRFRRGVPQRACGFSEHELPDIILWRLSKGETADLFTNGIHGYVLGPGP